MAAGARRTGDEAASVDRRRSRGRVSWRGRRATFDWSAEGATADEAVARLRNVVARPMQLGAQAALIDVPHVTSQLWLTGVGTIPDDEVTQLWLDAIIENRRKMDADPNIL